jgi:signal transduction histidine kinase
MPVPLPGGTRRIVVGARPLHDAAGRVVGAVATGHDVTEPRELAADLAAFSAVAHDLRSPLTTIAGCTATLAGELTDPDPDPAARIGPAVELTRRLIEDLLAYAAARDAPLEPAPVDLAALVAAVSPTAVVDGTLPVLDADPGMMRRLFEHLIGDAGRCTPPGRPAEVHVSASPAAGGGVCVTVADRGTGIRAARRDRVATAVQPGAGTDGTGLGLAVCRRVVTRHGGTITVEDDPGGGTLIRVELPAARLAVPVP